MRVPKSIEASEKTDSSISLVTLESVLSDCSIRRFNLRGRRRNSSEHPVSKPLRQKSRTSLDYFDVAAFSSDMQNASFPTASTCSPKSVVLEGVLSSSEHTRAESSESSSTSSEDEILLRFLNLFEQAKSQNIKHAPLMPVRKASGDRLNSCCSSSKPLSMPVRKASSQNLHRNSFSFSRRRDTMWAIQSSIPTRLRASFKYRRNFSHVNYLLPTRTKTGQSEVATTGHSVPLLASWTVQHSPLIRIRQRSFKAKLKPQTCTYIYAYCHKSAALIHASGKACVRY